MFITIINDCRDGNEMGRQCTRASVLFPQANVTFIGINNFSEIEAAGNLVDVMDAGTADEGIILVNAAPRHGAGKKWPNGTPFGYFIHNKKLIATTVDGYTLSLAKKFGMIDKLYVTDLPKVIKVFQEKGKFDKNAYDRTIITQFRSFEYLPFLAKWVHDKEEVPSEEMSLSEIPEAPKTVWWVDNFGNSKTTMLPEEIGFEPGKKIKLKVGEFTCYNRLKDVPNGELGLIVGSSGYQNKRFLEIVVQGKSAANELELHSGVELF